MSDWEVLRRQVAIGGAIREGDRRSAGAYVSAARVDGLGPAAQTLSRPDGSFFFLDLPDADYSVVAKTTAQTTTVPAHVQRKGDGSLAMVWLDLQLGTET